ncbi:hypothetical protein LCGC14_0380940 [marine sediment metagenome]|uniref:Uncharacterized protein n=1 Tax=marine sediment metagenome TaxID=412755 RepID=A0A0F9WBD7_9ZZZZ
MPPGDITAEHLEELSTAERMAIVKTDKVRKYGQISIALVLIISSLGYLAWYAAFKASNQFLETLAIAMMALVIAGMGAAYAIFGLGRTVGRKA